MIDVDACDRCSLPWPACICDPLRPRRQPTPDEIERARARREGSDDAEPHQAAE
jgi:hypothetical protein